jgi:hypothetical protein
MIRSYGLLTTSQIIAHEFPPISSLMKQYEPRTIEKCICVLVSDLSASFKGELSKDDVEEVAVELMSTYLRNVTLEGIFVTCRKIKHTKIHGRLSVNKVLTELKAHFEDMSSQILLKNQNEHLSRKFDAPRMSVERNIKDMLSNANAVAWYKYHSKFKDEKNGKRKKGEI